jgi:hypothetical protein
MGYRFSSNTKNVIAKATITSLQPTFTQNLMRSQPTRPFSVVTSIQEPTSCMRELGKRLRSGSCPLLIIGDKKGPVSFDVEGAVLHTLEMQAALPYHLASLLPTGHYSRKNLGYLIAISGGATSIYETDDDNAPLASWTWREEQTVAKQLKGKGWANVYQLFSEQLIWPRGLPLDQVRTQIDESFLSAAIPMCAPIQQGLANGAPDVDAIWRLILDENITFNESESIALSAGLWCPFNSQSTWWWPLAYPLMYLPSFCSFRMTDIWRSFIAQRCIWELGFGIVFHPAEVVQERNVHNLMRDFKDEISGYLSNQRIADELAALTLKPGAAAVGANLLCCYERLVECEFFPAAELPLVKAWLADLTSLGRSRNA